MKRLISFIFVLFTFIGYSADIHNIKIYSTSMDKEISIVVVLPSSYSESARFPVLYLLHGHGGNQNDWINGVPDIKNYADLYNFIIVCPDGNVSSWYFDSPVDKSWQYETYIVKELTVWIDKHYRTIASREGRAITGLSMGGHGALYLAFRNSDIFGAAGSMSGGVDIRPFPLNWDIAKRLGSYAEYPENWENNTVINLTHKLTPGLLSIIIDCGVNDFFWTVNKNLHKKLLERNIPHDFISRPGGHSWEYWANSIAFQSLFFHKFFARKKR